MVVLEEAVETLRPSESFSSPSKTKQLQNHRLSNHPYSQSHSDTSIGLGSTDTINGRTERLLKELGETNFNSEGSPSSSSSISPLSLPSPPPSAFLHHPLSSSSLNFHQPLRRLSPIYDNSPIASPSPALTTTISNDHEFDPTKDLAKAYSLYPRESLREADEEDFTSPATITTTPNSQPHSDEWRRSRSSQTNRTEDYSFGEEEEERLFKARRELEKLKGRRKLKWWLLFWGIVIVGIALGIGIAAATSHKKKNESEEFGKTTDSSRRDTEGQAQSQIETMTTTTTTTTRGGVGVDYETSGSNGLTQVKIASSTRISSSLSVHSPTRPLLPSVTAHSRGSSHRHPSDHPTMASLLSTSDSTTSPPPRS